MKQMATTEAPDLGGFRPLKLLPAQFSAYMQNECFVGDFVDVVGIGRCYFAQDGQWRVWSTGSTVDMRPEDAGTKISGRAPND